MIHRSDIFTMLSHNKYANYFLKENIPEIEQKRDAFDFDLDFMFTPLILATIHT